MRPRDQSGDTLHMRLIIPREKIALLCIDLQEEHRHDPRYLVEGYARILANVGALQRAARERAIAVCHAAYVIDPADLKPFNPVTEDGAPVFSAKGSALTDICTEVRPAAGEVVFVKDQPSVFQPGDRLAGLQAKGVEWLMVAGVWTEACVDATVKDAIRGGLRVLLVKDACGSGTRAMHQTGVLNLANRLYRGAVVDTARALALLDGDAAEAWQVEGAVPLQYTFETASALYDAL